MKQRYPRLNWHTLSEATGSLRDLRDARTLTERKKIPLEAITKTLEDLKKIYALTEKYTKNKNAKETYAESRVAKSLTLEALRPETPASRDLYRDREYLRGIINQFKQVASSSGSRPEYDSCLVSLISFCYTLADKLIEEKSRAEVRSKS